jgi:hypothetical protein
VGACLCRRASGSGNVALIVPAVAAIATIFAKALSAASGAAGRAVSGHAAPHLRWRRCWRSSIAPLAAIRHTSSRSGRAEPRRGTEHTPPLEVSESGVGTLAAVAIYLLVRPHVML